MSRSTSFPPPLRSPSLDAVCPALLSCGLPWELCEPVGSLLLWLLLSLLRLAVDEELLGELLLAEEDEELLDELLEEELLEDWDWEEELLDDELLADGLGGGLLGDGMLGGGGVVGLLALGQPVRATVQESSATAAVRRAG